MKMPESSKYSWAWITASRQLHLRACELVYVYLYNDSSNMATVTIYDGENAQGDIVAVLWLNVTSSMWFKPAEPIYCRRGLFLALSDDIEGCFVQWRGLGRESGG